jgi:hypothetical protein
MANEFIARNGLIAQNNSTISGSLNVTGGITGSLLGTATTASYAQQAVSASYATSGNGSFTGSFTGSFAGNGSGLTGVTTPNQATNLFNYYNFI